MHSTYAFLVLLMLLSAPALAQNNYDLVVGSDTVDVRLGDPVTYQTPGGETLEIVLQTQAVQEFDDGVVSFRYPADINVTQTMVDEGTKQIMAMAAYGDGVLLQEYRGVNPTFLVPMMLNEITKTEVSYGYEMESKDIEHELASGEVMAGTRATMRYLDEVVHYEVLAYGKGDHGLLIATMADEEFAERRNGFIEMIVSSIRLHPDALR